MKSRGENDPLDEFGYLKNVLNYQRNGGVCVECVMLYALRMYDRYDSNSIVVIITEEKGNKNK